MAKQATQAHAVNHPSNTLAPRVHHPRLPQYNSHRVDNGPIPTRSIEPVSPEPPRKRPMQIGNTSPEIRPAKRLAGNFRPMVGTGSLGASNYSSCTNLNEGVTGKIVHRPKPPKIIDLCPSPIISSRGSDELLTRDFLRRWNADKLTSSPKTSTNNASDEDVNGIAKVLTDLHGVKEPTEHFADPGI